MRLDLGYELVGRAGIRQIAYQLQHLVRPISFQLFGPIINPLRGRCNGDPGAVARASSRAQAKPIPMALPAPVTRATCPSRGILGVATIGLISKWVDARLYHQTNYQGSVRGAASGIRTRALRLGSPWS